MAGDERSLCRGGRGGPPTSPDWSDLLPDLLGLISSKLRIICDYIGFRSVCTSWRSAACPADLPLQRPWLVQSLSRGSSTSSVISLFNPINRRFYEINIPEARGKLHICGTPYGWLVMLGLYTPTLGHSVSLLNPITRAHISLPSLPRDLELTSTVPKIILGYHPAAEAPPSPRHLQVALWTGSSDNTLVYLREGDGHWTTVNLNFSTKWSPLDMVHMEGSIYCVGNAGKLGVFDVASSTMRTLIDTKQNIPGCCFWYDLHLTESEGNLILACQSSLSLSTRKRRTVITFTLHRRNNGREPKWVRIVDGIANNTTLFLNRKQQSFSICARDLPDLRGNRVYICVDLGMDEDRYETSIIYVFDVVAGLYVREIMACRMIKRSHDFTWLVPSLR